MPYATQCCGNITANKMIEDFWSTDPEYIEWLDSQEEQDDE